MSKIWNEISFTETSEKHDTITMRASLHLTVSNTQSKLEREQRIGGGTSINYLKSLIADHIFGEFKEPFAKLSEAIVHNKTDHALALLGEIRCTMFGGDDEES